MDKAGHVLSCALSLFEATDKTEKAKCSTGLCAGLWFAHLRVRRQLMQTSDLANDLKGQINALQKGTDDISSALAAKNAQLDTSVTELGKVRGQLDVSTVELAKMRAQLQETHLDLVAEKNKNVELSENVTDLQKQLLDFELVDARQVARQAKLQSELQGLAENKCVLEKQITSLSEACTVYDRKMSTLSAELGQCKKALSDLSDERNMFERGIQSWRVKCDELEERYKLSQSEVSKCQAEYGKCVRNVEQREQRIAILNGELEECRSRLKILLSENSNLQSQVAQLPALKLQIQELRQGPGIPSDEAPPRGELQYRQPFLWEGTKPSTSYFGEPATLNTLTSTTMTYSLWDSRISTGVNTANMLSASGQEKNALSGAVWATDLERQQATGMAVGEPVRNRSVLTAPAEGTAEQSNVLAPNRSDRASSKYKSPSHPDSSDDECEVPIFHRKKNKNKSAPLTWNTSEDFSEIRQIQKMLTQFTRDSKSSIHTHLNLYEKILRNFGIDSTVKMIRYLSWTFDKSEQNFFLSLDLNEFSTWKKAVLRQFSPYRNEQEALKYALNISCFPNQHPRDFLHVLKNAFSQAYADVDIDSTPFKNAFFHGLPQATKTQLALNYDGSQNLKWILAQAQRIFEVSKVPEPKENKQKSSGAKNISEINKASELSLEAGAKKGNNNPSKNKNVQDTKVVDSGDKSGSDTSDGNRQKYDFFVSKNYKGDRPIPNYQYHQNDRNRNDSGNSERERNVQNREPAAPRQNEQRSWVQQRERSPPRGRERDQQPSRLEAIEHQVKYLADAMGGFLHAQAQLESKVQRNQVQEAADNGNE